jgi:AraC-like DNA-binding protein
MRSNRVPATLSIRLIWPFIQLIGGDPRVLGFLLERGFRVQDLTSADARMPHALSMELLARAVKFRNDPALGLKAAALFSPADLQVLDFATRTCSTLRQAAGCATRYLSLLNDAAETTLEERGDVASWHFRIVDGVKLEPAANDFETALFLKLAAHYTGSGETPLEVHLSHSEPTDAAEYLRVFHVEPRMGMPHNAIFFRRAHLETPMLLADPGLHAVFDAEVSALLARFVEEHSELGRVRATLLSNLSRGRLSAEAVAKELGMSSATLRRRLAEEGTSLNRLVEELRRDLVPKYLKDPKLAISEVAFLLGYSHPTGFFKSFSRWFAGQTPAEVRAELLALARGKR